MNAFTTSQISEAERSGDLMTRTVTLMALADVPQHRGVNCRKHGLDLAVFRQGDAVYAMDDRCPHQGAALSAGRVADGMVRCPAHGLCFHLANGAAKASPLLRVKTYPARIDGDWVVIDLPVPEPTQQAA